VYNKLYNILCTVNTQHTIHFIVYGFVHRVENEVPRVTPLLSRAVTGLLMGHNTLRRHLHLLGLLDSPLCRKCGVREETSAHILCECEALASLRHVYRDSLFLAMEDIRSLGLGAIWNFSKAMGLP
jgi:hypothetical protein